MKNERRKCEVALVLSLIVVVISAGVIQATDNLYEHYNTGDDNKAVIEGDYWSAQTFTAESDHTVTSVKLKLSRWIANPGTVTVSIKATDILGHPTGPDLTSGTTNGNTLPTYPDCEWREITLPSYSLTSGTKYAIVVRAPSTGSPSLIWRCDLFAATYSGGNLEYSYNGGVSWESESDQDFMFEVYGIAVEPGPPCGCGDICVNMTGWWRDGAAFNASTIPIQHAIENANAGNTICVKDGSYTENIVVNANKLTINSENGSASTTVTAATSNDHVFEVTASNANISGFTVKGATGSPKAGIYLDHADHCNISDNNVSNNNHGIHLYHSDNNALTNNTFVNDGLFIEASCENTVENNTVNSKPLVYLEDASDYKVEDAGQVILVNCENITVENLVLSNTSVGVELWGSSNCRIMSNNASNNNHAGIYLYSSSNNTVMNDTTNSNRYYGVNLHYSSSNTLKNNTASNNNYGIYLYSSSNNTLMNNAANSNYASGIPLWTSSNNNTVTHNNASNNGHSGIHLCSSSSNNTVMNNIVNSNDNCGFELFSSSNNNTVTNNTANSNYYSGICLYDSSNNLIYNNYFNNTNNAYDDGNNIWNITKTSGINKLGGSYLGGNYWSDYAGEDLDVDGLGDTLLPYNYSGDIQNGGDWLPLVKPAPSTVFDTGSGTYPSIMGTHEGTITPNKTIAVHKMYTYPCAGTGGHTEYVRFHGNDLNVTKTWNGYVGSHHTIIFEPPITLQANTTYNYEIRTGSYPQIIHERTLPTSNGTINCTQFTDANGRTYNNWIPAIRLE